jgi:hypothetical protein
MEYAQTVIGKQIRIDVISTFNHSLPGGGEEMIPVRPDRKSFAWNTHIL